MTGILALFGSGEFTETIVPVDNFLLSKVLKPKIAIFPTAAGLEDTWSRWITDGESHYKRLGVTANGFKVIDKKSANDTKIVRKLKEYNFFIFSGGDPGYLLETLKSSKVWSEVFELYKNGAILVGSSAGAMVMGVKVWNSIYKFDKEGLLLPWEKGLGITDFGILPHFDVMAKYLGPVRTKKANKNLPNDIQIVGIDENTAYINIDGKWITKGNGSVHLHAKV